MEIEKESKELWADLKTATESGLEGIELINKCTDEYDQQFIGTKFFRKDNNGG